jgi:hypothetical protein
MANRADVPGGKKEVAATYELPTSRPEQVSTSYLDRSHGHFISCFRLRGRARPELHFL